MSAAPRPVVSSLLDAKLRRAGGGLRVALGGYSAAGQKDRNDDAFSGRVPETERELYHKGALACIADGVSQSDRSHLASQLSVTQFAEDYYATPESWTVEEAAARVLKALNDWLCGQSQTGGSNAMVTTFSAVILKSRTFHIVHIGDSRVSLIRKGQVRKLTRDHTIQLSPGNSMLSAALGMDPRLKVDYQKVEAERGDVILLSTDGVSDYVPDDGLVQLLAGVDASSSDKVSEQICKQAVSNGSTDNVTCGLLVAEELPSEPIAEAGERVRLRAIPPVLSVGHKIDGLEVTKVLYSGTRSHLYKVRRIADGEIFVLKAPSLNFADDTVYLEGFAREQWVGRRLDHAGLMKVFPRQEDSQFLYLLSEYVRGQTLRDWMRDNPEPSLPAVRDIVADTISALRAMHRMGMVHRDIKPENIMISDAGDVKIIDYGTVQVAGFDELASVIVEDHAVGSVAYSAPEYILGQKATTQSDLFSLAVLTYEMLVGRRPYKLNESRRGKWTYASWGHVPARTQRKDIPRWVSDALEKGCASEPQDRYLALSEFIGDLKRPGDYARSKETQTSLLDRNPLAFWKGLSLFLSAVVVVLFILLLQAAK